ncbi:MAG: hypothetical protein JO222_10445, partial [Frankiales bacterium]|nr:hypothetical protein [Frankiales bacterium]
MGVVGGVLQLSTGVASATVTVTTTADSGAGSLRDAIASAAAGDTIVVPASASHYQVTSGELVINKALTIQGAGAATTIVDAAGTSRVFHVVSGVASGGTVKFQGLTITGGSVTTGGPGGAGVLVDPGIDATIAFANARVSNNTVNLDMGATGNGGGGGIYDNSTGTLQLTGTTVSGNSVTITDAQACCHGGGGIYGNGGPITLSSSIVNGNTVNVTAPATDSNAGTNGLHCCGGGGGIYQFPPAAVTVTSSSVSNNGAIVTGGDNDHGGGGLYLHDGGTSVTVTITGSSFIGNTTTVHGTTSESGTDVLHCCQGGGAIHSGPILHISDSTFRSNKATVVDGDCCHG